ncbi:DegT/DnrJ/EryC1/StrS family aminotransferase [Algoriphagus persicinus]|uniref:DegT/DnrJ/EryC1/StrS family aminotransferase n=1 Tax=Algoriphagus persicinus TaxID=3108754 RepID=UPI002B37C68F|nr:DegT/DnrJ/EryC1/StrS family aminotransferase [Algoriphagus sp. E1-3-M2]MEB2784747.1 DegT/DnrJ/EryC1/StrS family aminotransferase [Algoriphagus sp. E1-3-M2]
MMRLLRFGLIPYNLQDSGQNLAMTINTLDYTGGACPVSDEISTRVLCLPLYHSLTREEQEMIVGILHVIARDQMKSKINSVF